VVFGKSGFAAGDPPGETSPECGFRIKGYFPLRPTGTYSPEAETFYERSSARTEGVVGDGLTLCALEPARIKRLVAGGLNG
jgi:hypothetical protein